MTPRRDLGLSGKFMELSEIENSIKGFRCEYLVAYDATNKKVIRDKWADKCLGGDLKIDGNNAEGLDILVTHNHPSRLQLSPGDIAHVIRYGFTEIRAVNKGNVVFSMRLRNISNDEREKIGSSLEKPTVYGSFLLLSLVSLFIVPNHFNPYQELFLWLSTVILTIIPALIISVAIYIVLIVYIKKSAEKQLKRRIIFKKCAIGERPEF